MRAERWKSTSRSTKQRDTAERVEETHRVVSRPHPWRFPLRADLPEVVPSLTVSDQSRHWTWATPKPQTAVCALSHTYLPSSIHLHLRVYVLCKDCVNEHTVHVCRSPACVGPAAPLATARRAAAASTNAGPAEPADAEHSQLLLQFESLSDRAATPPPLPPTDALADKLMVLNCRHIH